MPKLSIITINYNNLEGLKRTVESLVNQTWREFEYIVIDGGSTDGSAEYIQSQSANIDYWVSEPDKGIFHAMNKGIKVSNGDYLLFLNSGDHFYDDTVLEMNHPFVKYHDLVCFNLKIINTKSSKIIVPPEELRFSDMYVGSLPHQATFIKKDLFTTIGLYDENYKVVSDWKFFIVALFKNNCSYKKINATLSCYYLDGISSTTDFSEETNHVLKENFKGFIFDYDELLAQRELVNTNRFKMLQEIEKTLIGKKIISLFFRTYILLFSKKKLKEVLHKQD